MPVISVIICTRNPRPHYLRRVLEALRAQSLRIDQWELLLIDNASDQPLVSRWDLSWHPRARHVHEDELGLTPARLRGIKEAKGQSLLFVDDDNVLHPEYLLRALEILAEMPWLGAAGGQILPEYEVPPPEWLLPYEKLLAIRRAERPRWSNAVDDWRSRPWGAGMIVRRIVCQRYWDKLQSDGVRKRLGRRGDSLFSAEDTDLVLTSLDLQLGFGVFPELVVTHLIPPERTTKDYILRITRGLVASNLLLARIRGDEVNAPTRRTFYAQVRSLYHFLKQPNLARDIHESEQAGYRDYLDLARELNLPTNGTSQLPR